jgi:hypothetical protein
MDDQKPQRPELQQRLARCRELAREYTEGVTAKNLCELAAEIEQEIRALVGGPGDVEPFRPSRVMSPRTAA